MAASGSRATAASRRLLPLRLRDADPDGVAISNYGSMGRVGVELQRSWRFKTGWGAGGGSRRGCSALRWRVQARVRSRPRGSLVSCYIGTISTARDLAQYMCTVGGNRRVFGGDALVPDLGCVVGPSRRLVRRLRAARPRSATAQRVILDQSGGVFGTVGGGCVQVWLGGRVHKCVGERT